MAVVASACRARSVIVCVAALLGGAGGAAEHEPGAGMLSLPDQGRLPGRLVVAPAVESGARGTLLWQSPGFAAPFEFHLDEIHAARFQPAAGRPESPWKMLLVGGDALGVDLEAYDGRRVTVRRGGPSPQRLAVDRAAIERIVRVGPGAAGGFVGPRGLVGWTQTPADSWNEEAAGIRTGVRGAAVERDVGGPARAVYDVVLSWRRAPACRIAVAASGQGRENPYQFEVFSDADGEAAEPSMVLVREEQENAASEPLVEAAAGRPDERPRRLRVVLFVDQSKGRLAVVLPERSPEPAADVTIPPPRDRAHSGRFRLVGGGDIGLESLRVTEWRGEQPAVERSTATALVRRDGSREAGELEPWAAGGTEFVVRGDGGASPVAREDVQEIVFAETEGGPVAEPAVRVTGRGEEVLGGDLVRVDEAAVWLRRDGIDEPVALPLDSLATLESRRQVAARPVPGRLGRLRREGTDVRGAVVAAGDRVGFRPVGSANASPLAVGPGGGAAVYYVEPETPAADDEVGGIGGQINQDDDGFFVVVMMRDDGAAAIDGRIQPGDRIMAIAPEEGSPFVETKGLAPDTVMNLLRGRIGTPVRLRVTANDGTDPREVDLVRGTLHLNDAAILRAALTEHARLAPGRRPVVNGVEFPAVVFLRTGDALPCAVDAIDESGIRIRTPLGEAARREAVAVPARLVQAVELVPAVSRDIDRTRMERLLTLPRMQRINPPTHLVRLMDGDYLRGRVTGLDARRITLALADAMKELPRDTVARVIWLHPEDLDDPPAGGGPADGPPAAVGLVVQGVAAGGGRVTVDAAGIDGAIIRGHHAAIGPATIDTETVNRLLFGAAIEAEARDLPYQKWKLKPAPEPRALRGRAAPNDG